LNAHNGRKGKMMEASSFDVASEIMISAAAAAADDDDDDDDDGDG
jgi:hypothetical protein